jgi:prophage antirepressor-like protein
MNTTMTTLAFQGVEIKPLHRDHQTWFRLPQIETALGYKSEGKSLARVFARHADEFTKSMTRVLKLKTAGGMQPVRIFSLRGAHLLAMFARTDVAKAFRAWVLDLIDAEIKREVPAAPALIASAQVVALGDIIKRRIAERVAAIPDPMNRAAAMRAAIKNAADAVEAKFQICDVQKLRADQFEAARDFFASMPVTWELMGDEAEKYSRRQLVITHEHGTKVIDATESSLVRKDHLNALYRDFKVLSEAMREMSRRMLVCFGEINANDLDTPLRAQLGAMV